VAIAGIGRLDPARRGSVRTAARTVRAVRGSELPMPRLALLLGLLAVTAAGCGAGGGPSSTVDGGADAARAGDEPRRLAGWRTDLTRREVPLSEFRDGGPPRDGIPPIDRPRSVGVAAAERFLEPREPVIAVAAGGAARAYPIRILVWHEIVNDRLGGRPILVSYCPLCNSALVFDRRVGGRTLDFGTTGKLRNSQLVMWDRRTESWWQQHDGRALVGACTGTELEPIDAQVLAWRDFRARHPRGTVLSQDTGFERDYGRTPYPGYENAAERPFLYDGRLDERLPPKERVLLIRAGGRPVVVPFSRLRREPVVAGRAGGRPFTAWLARGLVSALDAESIADSRDVGTAAAFVPRAAGRELTFVAAPGGRFRDRQTASTWDITGRAVAGPLRGQELAALRHDAQFWFAVAAFVPDARIAR
jgi:hypothetical protein